MKINIRVVSVHVTVILIQLYLKEQKGSGHKPRSSWTLRSNFITYLQHVTVI